MEQIQTVWIQQKLSHPAATERQTTDEIISIHMTFDITKVQETVCTYACMFTVKVSSILLNWETGTKETKWYQKELCSGLISYLLQENILKLWNTTETKIHSRLLFLFSHMDLFGLTHSQQLVKMAITWVHYNLWDTRAASRLLHYLAYTYPTNLLRKNLNLRTLW
jgi:hypothetical protein